MLVNAGSLIGTTVVTSVLGFAYWWLIARLFPPAAVGFASAAISAMMLLGTVCMLGLGTLLIGELPRQPGKEGSLISAALIVVGGVGGVFGILFAVGASFVAADLQPLWANGADIAAFAIGVSLTAITLVLDQALIGLLRGSVQFWRNTLFAVAKFLALFIPGLWLVNEAGMRIYVTWLFGNALSLLALVAFLIRRKERVKRTHVLPQWGLLRKLGAAALQHHVLNLILLAPPLILPILVTIQLSATANAWFYVSYMLANFVFGVPYALSTVLYAMGSAQPAQLAHKTRITLGLSLLAAIVANGVLQLGARQVLGLFGHIYAEQAIWSLRILLLAAFPITIKSHYIAINRIQGKIGYVVLPIAVATLLEVSAAAVGAHFGGVAGLSLGWLGALCAQAIFMSRTVYKAMLHTRVHMANDQLESNASYAEDTNNMDKARERTEFLI